MKQGATLTARLSGQLKALRHGNGWSLDDLAARSGVSRATLSRIENAGVSPTAEVLERLCAAFGLPVSRLLSMSEDSFAPHVPLGEQGEWHDPDTGLTRRSVSPPAPALAAQLHECHLPPDTRFAPQATALPGREHHLVLLDGALRATLADITHDLTAGDCLRHVGHGLSLLETGPHRGARYLLVAVG
ncbi:MAG: helix-turn-helix transcriptional regulator [Rhodobacteraceae bacterium]|nr:helix-turn-helix transcriptional regulator [Paracoccaceae bacterium]